MSADLKHKMYVTASAVQKNSKCGQLTLCCSLPEILHKISVHLLS